MAEPVDVLVLGGGPAALCIASELNQRGVAVAGIAPDPVDAPWPNTYGIWADELKAVGLEQLLEHRWSCLLYTSPSPRDYAASRMPSSA